MRRLMKILHEVGTVGMMGAIAAILVLLVSSQGSAPAEYLAVRRGIHDIARWLLFPSLAVTLFTGLIAIAIHRPFHDAGWAWIKAFLGVSVFEGTLFGINGNAREGLELARRIVDGTARVADLAPILRHETLALWIILVLSLVNIVLGVWRPKLRRTVPARRSRATAADGP